MQQPLQLKQILPDNSELNKYLLQCSEAHQLHLHELNDGALSMTCFNCPFHWVLTLEEEELVRKQMEQQGVKV